MAPDDQHTKKLFANLLRHKAPPIKDEEILDCYIKTCSASKLYFRNITKCKNSGTLSSTRKTLSTLGIQTSSLFEQYRLLDADSIIYMMRHGYKPNQTVETLAKLAAIADLAEKEAKSTRDKSGNDHLTYLVGQIHHDLGIALKPYKKKSTKQLVNDVFSLVVADQYELWTSTISTSETDNTPETGETSKNQYGIKLPYDIGRYFDDAKKFKDVFK